MKLYDFITSKRRPERYYRHIAFWLLRYLFIVQMIFGSMYFFRDLTLGNSFLTAFTFALYAVLAEMIFTYTIVYWLIPTFFKTSKFLFIAGLIFLSALLVIAESPVYIGKPSQIFLRVDMGMCGHHHRFVPCDLCFIHCQQAIQKLLY